jgi:hypothetical protein
LLPTRRQLAVGVADGAAEPETWTRPPPPWAEVDPEYEEVALAAGDDDVEAEDEADADEPPQPSCWTFRVIDWFGG